MDKKSAIEEYEKAIKENRFNDSGVMSDEDRMRVWERREKRIKEMYPERCIRSGLCPFEINGVEVWALNYENACKKAGFPVEKKKKRASYSNVYEKRKK